MKCLIIFSFASYFIWNFSILSGINIWKENGVQVIAQRFVLPHLWFQPRLPLFPSPPPSPYIYKRKEKRKRKKEENNNIYVGVFAFDHENLPLIMKIKKELCIIKIMLEVVPCEKDFALITIWINFRTKYSYTFGNFFLLFFYSLFV